MPWALLAKFWWIAPLAALLGWVAILTVERDRARANYATAQGTIASIQAQATIQAAAAKAKDEETAANIKSREAEYANSQALHSAANAALGSKLRNYQAALGACKMSNLPAPADGTAGPGGVASDTQAADRSARVNDALNALITAADHDAQRLELCRASWPR